jgi:recombination protein RecA
MVKAKTPAASSKTAAKKKATSGTASLVRAAILKHMGLKPEIARFTSYAHVSSGSFLINDIIGGSPTLGGKGPVCPGYPRKRITEIYGPASSGKTTAGLHAIAEVQKAGGCAMFLDFEQAIHHGYAKTLGVSFDPEKLLLYSPTTLEEGFQLIFFGIGLGIDLIVVDSVAAMIPKKELERKIEDEDLVGLQARKLSSLLKRVVAWLNDPELKRNNDRNADGTAMVFINQPRADIKTGGETTAGGKALKFYSSLRLEFRKVREESIKKKDPITGVERKFPYGNHTQVKVAKNKMDARQGSTTDIFIRFGSGIDDYYSVIAAGINLKVIRKEGAWYVYGGERIQGREKFRLYLKENPDIFKKIRDSVLQIATAAISEIVPDEDESDILSTGAQKEFGDDDEGLEAEAEAEFILDVNDYEEAALSAVEEDSEDTPLEEPSEE